MNKKYVAALAMTAMVVTGLGTLSAFADTQEPTKPGVQVGLQNKGLRLGIMKKSMPQRGMLGTVASVNGTTLTITVKARENRQATPNTSNAPVVATYTVDASKATVMKRGSVGSVSSISVGDSVVVLGSVNGTTITANRIMDGVAQEKKDINPSFTGNGQPVIAGSVTAVSGNTITLTNKSNASYTVDATSAKIQKAGAASTVTNIAVGDMVIVQGTVNGTSITATSVLDQGVAPAVSSTSNEGDNGSAKPQNKGFFGKVGAFFKSFF